MPAKDLTQLNLNELKQLQVDIENEIKDRQKQEVKNAREQILSIAQSLGLSVEELVRNAEKKSKSKAAEVRAQYHNPTDEHQTWSGRGRQPKWIVKALAEGKKLDDFRIQQ